MSASFRPELLLPAGNLEKLQTLLSYGADAVYLAGPQFGLRTRAPNFSEKELGQAVRLAARQTRRRRIYVVVNATILDAEMEAALTHLQMLERLGVDGVILSDVGLLAQARTVTQLPLHLSTQNNCLNMAHAALVRQWGVSRLVLARETTLAEAKAIGRALQMEIEIFIHGSMCMSYSGQCTLSHYTLGRDSNRGGCAHNCRFQYAHRPSGVHDFFLSSSDLWAIELIPALFEARIDSLKVEGRMKGPLYLATITRVYRQLIDCYASEGRVSARWLKWAKTELEQLPHRGYGTGSLVQRQRGRGMGPATERERPDNAHNFVATVLAHDDQFAWIEVKNGFERGVVVEVIPFEGRPFELVLDPLWSASGQFILSARPNSVVKIAQVFKRGKAQLAAQMVMRKGVSV